jgi:hypothetical protein
MQLSIHTEHHEHQPLETQPKTSEAPCAINPPSCQSISLALLQKTMHLSNHCQKTKRTFKAIGTCKSQNVHPNLEKKLSWVEYFLQI